MNKKAKWSVCIGAAALLAAIAMEVCLFKADPRYAWAAFALEFVAAAAAVLFLASASGRLKWAAAFPLAASLVCAVWNIVFLAPVKGANFTEVIHAGGGGQYLNSYKLAREYAAGREYMEIDFAFTADGALVCSHLFEYGGYSMQNKPTFEQFQNINFPGGVKGASASQVMDLLHEFPDLRIVFDTKEENSLPVINELLRLAEAADIDLYSRMIVQLYSAEDLKALDGVPFREYWFTNYKANYSRRQIERYFGGDERVTTIVLSERNWVRKAYAGGVRGKKIAVHTVNDLRLAEFYARRGADFVYCDYGF